MTDWSKLTHAYGSAEDIPPLLDRLASDPTPEDWADLWSALCHQGSVYPASFASLPWLASVADGGGGGGGGGGAGDRTQRVNAVALAAAIIAGATEPPGTGGGVRERYAAEIATLLSLANAHLRTTSDGTAPDHVEYAYLLEAVLAFEGVAGWSEELAWGLTNEEYQLACPACEAGVFVVIGERGHFCSRDDHAPAAGDAGTRPLRPADPTHLDGIGRRLHDTALADGQREIAHALTYVFGDATCPDCGTDFSVAAQIDAEWPTTAPGAHEEPPSE
ncbi:hypothetical protein ACFVT5_12385 [Streptomyces sp. NPDC058001]|uniref:hypothetical protein n=1 Tax=Streptomyces sp. NPDC058001 TaxID=3346300 RepID=UPI0036E503EB